VSKAAGPKPKPDALSEEERARTFAARLSERGAHVTTATSVADAQKDVERLLRERAWASVAGAPELAWPGAAGPWVDDPRTADFGLTEAGWAVAETGTVVVTTGPGMRRGHSLLPPAVGFFLAKTRIVNRMDDILRELSGTPGVLPSCVSLISGPSSTADITGVRVTGVHGPGEVFVWVIDEGWRAVYLRRPAR
jgi:L-lactate dehydrogenase complex protein LldG